MGLKMEMTQNTVLSQKMIQSAQILQMSAAQLDTYIKDMALENPLMDLEEHSAAQSSREDWEQKLEWLSSTDEQNRVYYSSDASGEEKDTWNFSVDEGEALADYLMSQLVGSSLTQKELEVLNYMALCLDSKGYFSEDLGEVARRFHISEKKAGELLSVLQSLEPAGAGARDLKECLLLQLDRQKIYNTVVREIVEHYLELLGKNQLHMIAKKMKIPVEEVSGAVKVIKALNPKPGSGFSSREHLKYITPDVVVVRLGGYYEILLNEGNYPKISLNSYYLKLLEDDSSRETKDYVHEKVRQAQWVMECISQRSHTLMNVTKTIIDVQSRFFAEGPEHLKPMKLEDIAGQIHVHESTVSRAVRDKYIQCSWGIYPMNYFFSKGIAVDTELSAVTPETVKRHIREIIDQESKAKPLSDRLIAQALDAQGIHISRRTVAKYREQEGIKDAGGRKIFD